MIVSVAAAAIASHMSVTPAPEQPVIKPHMQPEYEMFVDAPVDKSKESDLGSVYVEPMHKDAGK